MRVHCYSWLDLLLWLTTALLLLPVLDRSVRALLTALELWR
jgi:hypothetical protein